MWVNASNGDCELPQEFAELDGLVFVYDSCLDADVGGDVLEEVDGGHEVARRVVHAVGLVHGLHCECDGSPAVETRADAVVNVFDLLVSHHR